MLSVIIPAREEEHLERTIRNILENARGEIEILVQLDGWLPPKRIKIGDDRVIFTHHKEVIGQRACINYGARKAKGKYIMKLDAHCAVDEGFDVKLAADCEPEWTVIPRMYNLDIKTFKPKWHKKTDYMYITSPDSEKPFRAMYYSGAERSKWNKRKELIDETMCNMGPGWFMHKDRFWLQGGCDENHEGGWGQQGIEVSLKAWLSGGKLMVNKKTWFAHWFRGGVQHDNGRKGFPYSISGRTINKVRKYSKDLWLNNKWEGQVRTLEWLIDKFDPPGWNMRQDLTILFYTANVVSNKIIEPVVRSINRFGYPIISISQEPMDLGKNIVVPKEQSLENIYKQVLIGAKKAKTKYVALCEDDCFYTKEHFTHTPKKDFAYNLNRWILHLNEKVYSLRKKPVLSQCIANREALIKCLEETPNRIGEMGYWDRKKGNKKYEYETFETEKPNLIVAHKRNVKRSRKFLGEDAEPCKELPEWGHIDYWLNKFKEGKESKYSYEEQMDIAQKVYWRVIKEHKYPKWRGHSVMKLPADLVIYQQVIYQNKPDFIIETGTKWGGSTFFLADMLELNKNGHVISVDIAPKVQPPHPRITYFTGSSIDAGIVGQIREMVKGKKVMLILDSKHTKDHVIEECKAYADLVTRDQYVVFEDCYDSLLRPHQVMKGRDWFLQNNRNFKLIDLSKQFFSGVCKDGWCRRINA